LGAIEHSFAELADGHEAQGGHHHDRQQQHHRLAMILA
jgi:hypothetical protein